MRERERGRSSLAGCCECSRQSLSATRTQRRASDAAALHRIWTASWMRFTLTERLEDEKPLQGLECSHWPTGPQGALLAG